MAAQSSGSYTRSCQRASSPRPIRCREATYLMIGHWPQGSLVWPLWTDSAQRTHAPHTRSHTLTTPTGSCMHDACSTHSHVTARDGLCASRCGPPLPGGLLFCSVLVPPPPPPQVGGVRGRRPDLRPCGAPWFVPRTDKCQKPRASRPLWRLSWTFRFRCIPGLRFV